MATDEVGTTLGKQILPVTLNSASDCRLTD